MNPKHAIYLYDELARFQDRLNVYLHASEAIAAQAVEILPDARCIDRGGDDLRMWLREIKTLARELAAVDQQ